MPWTQRQQLRVLLRCEGIVPGMSGGIEHFAMGLIGGLVEAVAPDEAVVASVAKGTEDRWTSTAPPSDRVSYLPVASTASLAHASARLWRNGLLRQGRGLITQSRLGRGALNRFRQGVDSELLESVRPDVTHFPFHLQRLSGPTPVVTVHDLREVTVGGTDDRRHADQLRANIQNASAIVTSWRHPFDQLTSIFPAVAGKTFVIPFPVMNPPLGPLASAATAASYILYPAATASHKNHVGLVRALGMIDVRRRPRLVCTGALVSPWYEQVRQLAVDVGVQQSVEFRGFVDRQELDQLYRGAAAVVVPSRWEAASGPVFEAFAYGVPVACSDVPPIRSQVEQTGGEVAFFDPDNPGSIAAAILEVLAESERYRAGSRRGGEWLAGQTWLATALSYLEVWRWAAAEMHGPRPLAIRLPPIGEQEEPASAERSWPQEGAPGLVNGTNTTRVDSCAG